MASVVGLLHLAIRHGTPGDGVERVTWDDADGQRRTATISRWIFAADSPGTRDTSRNRESRMTMRRRTVSL
ncbi:MAG: hypothetical protein ACI38U_02525 [Corynebacterium sp.]|uniref:hypothetical protein n=1 Tax=Corynebacterium sp. TaxID=1720 RepID=UPI003F03ABD1